MALFHDLKDDVNFLETYYIHHVWIHIGLSLFNNKTAFMSLFQKR